jgi:hypothetical protein
MHGQISLDLSLGFLQGPPGPSTSSQPWSLLRFYVPEAYLRHFSYRCWFLNCSVQKPRGGGGRGRGSLEGVVPENHIELTSCSTKYRILNTIASKLMYIQWYNYKFACFLRHCTSWFWWGQIHYSGQWKEWALKISLVAISGPSKSWSKPSIALEMDLPPSKSWRPAPYKQQVHY